VAPALRCSFSVYTSYPILDHASSAFTRRKPSIGIMHTPAKELLKKIRERASLSVSQVSRCLGISEASYYDLEHFEDLYDCLSLREVLKLVHCLSVKPHVLFGDEHIQIITPDELLKAMQDILVIKKMSLSDFEELIGWDMKEFLDCPLKGAMNWNIDCAKDVCDAINLNWRALLYGLSVAELDGQSKG